MGVDGIPEYERFNCSIVTLRSSMSVYIFWRFILCIIYSGSFLFCELVTAKEVILLLMSDYMFFHLSYRKDIWCLTWNLEFQRKSYYERIWVVVFAPTFWGFKSFFMLFTRNTVVCFWYYFFLCIIYGVFLIWSIFFT